jgi:hypothetical protein
MVASNIEAAEPVRMDRAAYTINAACCLLSSDGQIFIGCTTIARSRSSRLAAES